MGGIGPHAAEQRGAADARKARRDGPGWRCHRGDGWEGCCEAARGSSRGVAGVVQTATWFMGQRCRHRRRWDPGRQWRGWEGWGSWEDNDVGRWRWAWRLGVREWGGGRRRGGAGDGVAWSASGADATGPGATRAGANLAVWGWHAMLVVTIAVLASYPWGRGGYPAGLRPRSSAPRCRGAVAPRPWHARGAVSPRRLRRCHSATVRQWRRSVAIIQRRSWEKRGVPAPELRVFAVPVRVSVPCR